VSAQAAARGRLGHIRGNGGGVRGSDRDRRPKGRGKSGSKAVTSRHKGPREGGSHHASTGGAVEAAEDGGAGLGNDGASGIGDGGGEEAGRDSRGSTGTSGGSAGASGAISGRSGRSIRL
jgi:hypothetical protein